MTLTKNFYTLSLKLLDHRKEYFNSEFTSVSTDNYFANSLDEIHSFFQYKYATDYLFSSIAYSHDGRVRALPYRFNLPETNSESEKFTIDYAVSLINYLTQNLINEKGHLSFTQIMLSEKNREHPIKVLLFEGKSSEESEEYKPIDIVEFDLGKVSWDKLGNLDKFKAHDFVTHKYGISLHEEFANTFGNPILKMTAGAPENNLLEEFNRLISVYLELNGCFQGTNYFYFIKPQSPHDVFSGVLLLGLKKRIPIDEFTMWVHIFYRLLSEISIKKIQQLATERENLKYRANINYTVHYIKTMLGGLMDSPLNELKKKYPLDENVKLVRESKEIIESLSSILNLITKVEEGSVISNDDLTKSNLFRSGTESLDIDNLFEKIERHRKDRGDSKKAEIEKGNVNEVIPLIKYPNLFPTENFYLLYFLTLIENAFEHGKINGVTNTITIILSFDSADREFTALNIARNDSIPPKMEAVKGNIKLFDVLLRTLNIGSIRFAKEPVGSEYHFKTILKLYPDHD